VEYVLLGIAVAARALLTADDVFAKAGARKSGPAHFNEDTPEPVCTAPNHYHHYTVPHLGIHLKECVQAALRYTPTRICVV
jgi:hypothetical protein